MTLATPEITTNPLDGKNYVDSVLWERLTGRILGDLEFKSNYSDLNEVEQLAMAECILDQAVAFLRLVGSSSGEEYSPSEQVDIGWHAFLMYTREYAEFCQRIAGRMIHHAPSDIPGVDYGTGNIQRTIAALEVRGMYVDNRLWPSAADCNGCGYCSGDSCSGSSCNGE